MANLNNENIDSTTAFRRKMFERPKRKKRFMKVFMTSLVIIALLLLLLIIVGM